MPQCTIIGAGLAGCEAALWLAGRGVQVTLYEQKPVRFSPAHKSAGFAELVCSNSLKAERPDSASGLLKLEMRAMGSRLLPCAESARVAAGGALAAAGVPMLVLPGPGAVTIAGGAAIASKGHRNFTGRGSGAGGRRLGCGVGVAGFERAGRVSSGGVSGVVFHKNAPCLEVTILLL